MGDAVRLITFNVQHGRRPDGVVDLDLLGEVCAGLGADVLALQEIGGEEAARVADVGAMALAFGPAIEVRGRGYGNAVLARGPIDDVEVLALPSPEREPRSAVVCRTLGLSVASAHLALRGAALDQVPVLLDALRARPGPRVVLGDLNLDAEDVVADGFTLVDAPPTWPAKAPRRRIDHVLLDGVVAEAVTVPAVPVSDHRPLVVDVSVR